MNPRMKTLLAPALAAALMTSSCLDSQAIPVADQPISAAQAELLELAFGAASALPANPHIKNRSLAQEEVVTACLELDQPQRALVFAGQIDNWRRGAAYADCAFHLAQRGATAEVSRLLDLAREVASHPEEEGGEGWRSDRIRVKIARTQLWLGQDQLAAEMVAGADVSEADEMADARAHYADAAAFDAHMEAVPAAVETLNFDLVRNALVDCAELFNQFYDDAVRRDRAEQLIKSSWGSLPIMVRTELMLQLVEFALDHADSAKALALVNETQEILDGSTWRAEDEIAMRARLAALRHRAGDPAKARAEADAARGLYEVERVRIVDIDRAGTLRPVAEAYRTLGDVPSALAVYQQAAAEATVNPNSRPRAMDLAALCCSMAVYGIEPDAELWQRLREMRAALGDPW